MSLNGCPGEILGRAHAFSDAAPLPEIAATEADRPGVEDRAKVKESISRFVEFKIPAQGPPSSWSIVTLGARRPMPMEVANMRPRNDADLESD